MYWTRTRSHIRKFFRRGGKVVASVAPGPDEAAYRELVGHAYLAATVGWGEPLVEGGRSPLEAWERLERAVGEPLVAEDAETEALLSVAHH